MTSTGRGSGRTRRPEYFATGSGICSSGQSVRPAAPNTLCRAGRLLGESPVITDLFLSVSLFVFLFVLKSPDRGIHPRPKGPT
jgi:hypothetical protein